MSTTPFDPARIRQDVSISGVRYCSYEPGDGLHYALFVSDLPTRAEGGDPATHKLVTLYEPYKGAYVFSAHGYLDESYVHEKFPGVRVYGLPAIVGLIRYALDREVADVEGVPA